MSKQERMSADEFNRRQRAKNLGCSPGALPTHPTGKRCVIDGIHFDSGGEGDFYLWLKEQPWCHYIDVHPTLTLPGGIRFKADFVAYLNDGALVYDFKGRRPGTDFNRIWKLFNAFHPLSPLVVVRRDGKGWKEHLAPPAKRDW